MSQSGKQTETRSIVFRLLGACVALVAVFSSVSDLRLSPGGMRAVADWTALLSGALLGLHVLAGWTPAPLDRAVTKSNVVGSVLRAIAIAFAVLFVLIAPGALVMGGSLSDCVALLGWALILGFYAVTGWNPLIAVRSVVERSRRNRVSQVEGKGPNL